MKLETGKEKKEEFRSNHCGDKNSNHNTKTVIKEDFHGKGKSWNKVRRLVKKRKEKFRSNPNHCGDKNSNHNTETVKREDFHGKSKRWNDVRRLVKKRKEEFRSNKPL